MMQNKSSTSSTNCKVIGAGKVLAYLRGDLQQAKQKVFIIGPWLDGFFVREIISCLRKNIVVQCLVRVENHTEEMSSNVTYQALQELKGSFADFKVKSLAALHAKVIIIDDSIVYLGSSNWYRYSLEQAKEITLRTSLAELKDLSKIIDEYWQSAKVVDVTDGQVYDDREDVDFNSEKAKKNSSRKDSTTRQKKAPEINYEILDPMALKILQDNPKAFVKHRK